MFQIVLLLNVVKIKQTYFGGSRKNVNLIIFCALKRWENFLLKIIPFLISSIGLALLLTSPFRYLPEDLGIASAETSGCG